MKDAKTSVWAGLAASLACFPAPRSALDKVTFGTNWLAEAEHGGYYQAVVDGTYAKYGLDVTILHGGPQANNGSAARRRQDRILHGRQPDPRPSTPWSRILPIDHRRRRFPEGPADHHVASGRRPGQMDRSDQSDRFRRQGRRSSPSIMDEGPPTASRKRTSSHIISTRRRSSPTRIRSSRAI